MLPSRGHGSDFLRVWKHICFEMSIDCAVCSASLFSSAADQFNLIAKKRWNQEGFDAKRHEDQTHDQRNVTHDDLFVVPELIIREEDWANHKVDEGKL